MRNALAIHKNTGREVASDNRGNPQTLKQLKKKTIMGYMGGKGIGESGKRENPRQPRWGGHGREWAGVVRENCMETGGWCINNKVDGDEQKSAG